MQTSSSAKRNKSAISIILAIVLLIACLIPCMFTYAAKADSSSGEAASDSAGETKTLYYITDCQEGADMCQQLSNDGYISTYKLYYYYHDDFWYNFTIDYITNTFSDIKDCYVIFDIRYGFIADNEDSISVLQGGILTQLFSSLKANDCRIMFICGTDELRFEPYNEFLDYVDIHINTDRITNFIANVLYKAEQACGDKKIRDCTFILDKCFAPEDMNSWYSGWFFKYYFLTYIKMMYMDEIRYQGLSVEKVFYYDNGLFALCHLGGDYFYDIFERKIVSIYDNYVWNQYFENQYIFAIGGTWEGEDYTYEWLDTVIAARDVYGLDFPIYIFNSNDVDLCAYYYDYIYFDRAAHNYDFYDIVIDFINDMDLTQYDNWDGRCVVTHRIMFIGEDGWMENMYDIWSSPEEWGEFSDGSIFSTGWSVVMSEDDLNYFYGIDNLF